MFVRFLGSAWALLSVLLAAGCAEARSTDRDEPVASTAQAIVSAPINLGDSALGPSTWGVEGGNVAYGAGLYLAAATRPCARAKDGGGTMKEAFPSARILVASEAIKADTLAFSTWMDSVGWLDKHPQMKPKSDRAPDGFDYAAQIEVLGEGPLVLEGGGVLENRADYPPTESGHMSTVFVPEEKALLTSDLTYHGVLAWAGQGVLREHIANWVSVLGDLKAKYSAPDVLVFPGHGAPSDPALFDRMRAYLDDFVSAVGAERTNAEALARMQRLYPGFAQEDFLLAQSVAFHGPDGRASKGARQFERADT